MVSRVLSPANEIGTPLCLMNGKQFDIAGSDYK